MLVSGRVGWKWHCENPSGTVFAPPVPELPLPGRAHCGSGETPARLGAALSPVPPRSCTETGHFSFSGTTRRAVWGSSSLFLTVPRGWGLAAGCESVPPPPARSGTFRSALLPAGGSATRKCFGGGGPEVAAVFFSGRTRRGCARLPPTLPPLSSHPWCRQRATHGFQLRRDRGRRGRQPHRWARRGPGGSGGGGAVWSPFRAAW